MKDIEMTIGKKIKVTKSSNKQLENIEGTVTDETKNTITIETKKGIKKLIKKQIEIEIK